MSNELDLLIWGLAIFGGGFFASLGLFLFGTMCYTIKDVILRHASLLRMLAAWWWWKLNPEKAKLCLEKAEKALKQVTASDTGDDV